MSSLSPAFWAECFGTFILVFCGTGAVCVHHETAAVTHPGIALTFGLVVTALIYAFGEISGAHFNPAVTVAFVYAGRFPARQVPSYLMAQVIGAVAASGLLRLMFPADELLGATQPCGPVARSFVLEVILTWALMLIILGVSTGSRETGVLAGVAIGAVIGLEAMFAGPICGASMNPVRSLAPALVSGHLDHLWIYLVAPPLGAALAVPCFALVRPTSSEPTP